MNKKKDLLSESQQQLPVPGPGSPTGEIIIYNPTDAVRIEVLMERETVWLTQTQIGHLFGVDRTVIVRHIGNIYRTGELEESATCAKNAQVQSEGKRLVERIQNYYNLDMILSVGYRVNSRNATAFRRWANTVLKEYLLAKGLGEKVVCLFASSGPESKKPSQQDIIFTLHVCHRRCDGRLCGAKACRGRRSVRRRGSPYPYIRRESTSRSGYRRRCICSSPDRSTYRW